MYRLRLLAMTCLFSAAACAQGADPFAAIHRELNGAADLAAARSVTPSPGRDAADGLAVDSSTDKAVPPAQSGTHAVARVSQLRATIEPILRAEGLPPEITAVVLVESGGRPTALSPKGALGLWQLVPETARRYGLLVTPATDERLNVEKATRAAARYLRDLHRQFGDWPLALAAYNAGEHAVTRAMRRTGAADFVRLSAALPEETRNYVPAVLAARPFFGVSQSTLVGTGTRVVFALTR